MNIAISVVSRIVLLPLRLGFWLVGIVTGVLYYLIISEIVAACRAGFDLIVD